MDSKRARRESRVTRRQILLWATAATALLSTILAPVALGPPPMAAAQEANREDSQPANPRLQLWIAGARNARGSIQVAVFTSEETWLREGRARLVRRVPASTSPVSVTVDGLPPGTYAVSVFHDENNNRRIDLKTFPPMPDEGVGTSRNARPRMSAPSFEGARFVLDRNRRFTISLRYL